MTIRFGIRFKTGDYTRWLYALRRVNRAVILERSVLPKKCATDYYQLVHKNIMSQRYAGSYPAYSPRYAKWKEKVAARMDYWRLYDALLNNLKAFRVKADSPDVIAYMGGIPQHASHNNKRIAMYGAAVESGKFGAGKNIKPRPVFWPTALEYSQKKWKERNQQSLNKIKEAWR